MKSSCPDILYGRIRAPHFGLIKAPFHEHPCLSLSIMRLTLIALSALVAVASAQQEAFPECALKCLDDPDIADLCAGVCVTAPHPSQSDAVAETNLLAASRPFVSAQTPKPTG